MITARIDRLQRELETGYLRGLLPDRNRIKGAIKIPEHQLEKKRKQMERLQEQKREQEKERERLLSHDVASSSPVEHYQEAHTAYQEARAGCLRHAQATGSRILI